MSRPSKPPPAGRRAAANPHVLYVSHTSIVGGGELALLDHLRAMPTEVRTAAVICPPGELASRLQAVGVSVVLFRGTAASFRLRARDLVRIAREAVSSALAIRHVTRTTAVTVIHANSIRAGLLAILAGLGGGPPVIVHVHDVLPTGRLSRLVRSVILHRAAGLIAVSPFARTAFLDGFSSSHRPFDVLINPIDAARVLEGAPEHAVARERLGLDERAFVLAVVGQITPWKGQETAIRAVARVVAARPDLGVRLLLVGEPRFVDPHTRYANEAYMTSLRELVDSLGLAQTVQFLGHRRDVPTIMRAIDLLLLPSWTEPLSRAMLEAMILGTPVLATTRGGPADIIVDGESGYLAPPRRDKQWARRIEAIGDDPVGRTAVAERARTNVVQLLDLNAYVEKAMAHYEQVESRRR